MNDKLFYNINMVESYYRRIFKKLTKLEAPYGIVNHRSVIKSPEAVNNLISDLIKKGEPFMVARFGSTELSVMNQYKRKIFGHTSALDRCSDALCMYSGFFPNNIELICKFSELMLESCAYLDLVGLWNNNQELYFVRNYAPQSKAALLYCLEPYYHIDNSWTMSLAGKKVLVIHPFENTIKLQFKVKEKLFTEDFWPDCELKTIKAVQTIAGTRDDRFATWFEALDWMKKEIDKTDFDVALIGCGAYGFPLAAYVKSIGRQAIHLGGATSCLFGIKNKRWEKSEYNRSFFNEYWTRASKDETPANAGKVEGGCYW